MNRAESTLSIWEETNTFEVEWLKHAQIKCGHGWGGGSLRIVD